MTMVKSIIARLENEINEIRARIDYEAHDTTRMQLSQKLSEKLQELETVKSFDVKDQSRIS